MIAEEEDFNKATHAVLPGVGAFGYCAKNLEKSGLMNPLMRYISNDKPLLGICVGMQLMLDSSEELGSFKGLSLISGKIESLKDCIDDKKIKIPHVGWNSVKFLESNKYFSNSDEYDFILITLMHFLASINHLLLVTQIMELTLLQLSQKIYLLANFILKKSKKRTKFPKIFFRNYKC